MGKYKRNESVRRRPYMSKKFKFSGDGGFAAEIDTYMKMCTKSGQYDTAQLSEIRKGLLLGFEVDEYTNPAYTYDQMHEIFLGMQSKVHYRLYLDPKIHHAKMRALRQAMEQRIPPTVLKKYVKQAYSGSQVSNIVSGLIAGLDVSYYDDPRFTAQQMVLILRGLKEKLDVSYLSNPAFSTAQMQEILLGLRQKLDVTPYAKPEFTVSEMNKIRLELIQLQKELLSIPKKRLLKDAQKDFIFQRQLYLSLGRKKQKAIVEAHKKAELQNLKMLYDVVTLPAQKIMIENLNSQLTWMHSLSKAAPALEESDLHESLSSVERMQETTIQDVVDYIKSKPKLAREYFTKPKCSCKKNLSLLTLLNDADSSSEN